MATDYDYQALTSNDLAPVVPLHSLKKATVGSYVFHLPPGQRLVSVVSVDSVVGAKLSVSGVFYSRTSGKASERTDTRILAPTLGVLRAAYEAIGHPVSDSEILDRIRAHAAHLEKRQSNAALLRVSWKTARQLTIPFPPGKSMIFCQQCGEAIGRVSKARKFCGDCRRQRASIPTKEPYDFNCPCSTENCHNLGATKRSSGRVKGRFCSVKCYWLTRERVTNGKLGQMQICRLCGKEIGEYTTSSAGRLRNRCDACLTLKKLRPMIHCTTCQVPFTPRRVDHQYCSSDCRPYNWDRPNRRDGRRDPRSTNRWQRLRLEVLAEETHCGLCGEAVDFGKAYPHPASPSADHIISINGDFDHPLMFERSNLQLAHFGCQCLQGAWIRVNQKRTEKGYAPLEMPPGYLNWRKVKNRPKRPRRT